MYESVSDFNNDEPGRLLFAAVSYMYMYTCTSACNIIRERGEGGREGREGGREWREKGGEGEGERERKEGREGYNDIHNITAFIKHSIDLKGFSHMLSAISSLCLSPLISAFPLSLSLSLLSSLSHSLLLQVKLYYTPVGQSDIIVLDPDIDTIMELDGNIKIQV